MSAAHRHPFDVVLHLIAQAAPQPWRPYHADGLDRRVLDDVLEVLWLEGLIQKAPASLEPGPAIELTALGRRVLDEPGMLARLCEGRAIDPTLQASVVRANLSHPPRVWVCKVILASNFAVFLWGLLLAWRAGVARTFLEGFTMGQRGMEILHATGSLRGDDLLNGEWQRLITSGFNHLGVIHLGVNMYSLFSVGTFIEQRFGWWRFLIIYFVSIWTGSCLAMAYQPHVMTVGASGGLFGVFAALIGWLMLYGKHLPAASRRAAWQNVIVNVVILAVLSYTLRHVVSHWGHIGGALGGFAACIVLHAQRFGPAVVRWLAVPVLLLLPAGGWAVLRHAEATEPRWALLRKEVDRFEKRLFLEERARPVSKAIARTLKTCQDQFDPLRNQHPDRRDAKKVEAVIAALQEQKETVESERQPLASVKTTDGDIAAAREKGLEALSACATLLDDSIAYLRNGKPKRADEMKVVTQFGKVDDLEHAWGEAIKKLRAQD